MDLPYELILNIIISQLFFAAAQNIIEIIREIITRILAWLYYKYDLPKGYSIIYKDFLRPLIMGIMFIIAGIIVSCVLMAYNDSQKNKNINKLRKSINAEITQDNVVNLLKNYVKYYELTK